MCCKHSHLEEPTVDSQYPLAPLIYNIQALIVAVLRMAWMPITYGKILGIMGHLSDNCPQNQILMQDQEKQEYLYIENKYHGKKILKTGHATHLRRGQWIFNMHK